MQKILLAAAIGLSVAACSDPKTAQRVLADAGLTSIETQGYSFMGCGNGDNFATKFTAKNSQGRPVAGVVCSGWFKGATIRFY